MSYESIKYWNKRANPNNANATTKIEAHYLKPFLKDKFNLLDFGAGIGRTFELYKDMDQVTGLDFSEIYETQARASAKANGLNYEHIIHNVHSEPLPFENGTFEAGVALCVLLHAKPGKEVKTILTELARVCDKVLVVSYYGQGQKLAAHNFEHDYETLIDELGLTMYEAAIDLSYNQITFVYGR